MNTATMRSEIYLLLAEGFKRPTQSFIEEQSDMVDCLREALSCLGYDIPVSLYEQWPVLADKLPDLDAAYRQSFIFPVNSRVVPVESIYRRWTHDSTANVPFAAEKGFLLSDHALHMRSLYQAYGLTIPDEFQSMPDHICLELEFTAFLLNNAEPEQVNTFIREHLTWVEELRQDAEKLAIPAYYRQLIGVTAQFIAHELRLGH